ALTTSVGLKPDSPLDQMFQGGQAQRNLTRLPDRPWLSASSIDLEGFDLGAAVEEILAIIPNEGETAFLNQSLAASLPMIKLARAAATAYYVPQQGAIMGGGLINGVTVIESDDAPAFLAANESYLKALSEMVMAMPADAANPGGPPRQLAFSTQYREGALRVDGVRVDQFQVQVNLPPDVMQQAGQALMLTGGTGQSGYLAAIGDHAVMTTTTDAQMIKIALHALRENRGLGAGGPIPRVRKAMMPPNLVAESYLNVAGLAQMFNQVMLLFNPRSPMVLDAPPELPPLALGVGAENGTVAARFYVPNEVIRFVKESVDTLMPPAGGTNNAN
ncbi:MAG: hypothetical protein R3336_08750, partial [Phycisphaeraceae bacterium]|nr:hypothetical protein [Phycisphaeraceae bacterium]